MLLSSTTQKTQGQFQLIEKEFSTHQWGRSPAYVCCQTTDSATDWTPPLLHLLTITTWRSPEDAQATTHQHCQKIFNPDSVDNLFICCINYHFFIVYLIPKSREFKWQIVVTIYVVVPFFRGRNKGKLMKFETLPSGTSLLSSNTNWF